MCEGLKRASTPESQLVSPKYGHLKAMRDIMALNPSVSSGQTVAAETVASESASHSCQTGSRQQKLGSAAAPKASTANKQSRLKKLIVKQNVAHKK